MKFVYNETGLYNLAVLKESKRWMKQQLIGTEQFQKISESHSSNFFHPNFIIRILLFVATLFALSGITGLFAITVLDSSERIIGPACTIYGIVSFIFLEKVFIKKNHYKSGVTEALLYHACAFTIAGIATLAEFNEHTWFIVSLLVLTFAAIRYLDLVCTLLAVLAFAGFLFYECYNLGGVFQQIIPFVFIIAFTPLYFVSKSSKKNDAYKFWFNNLLLVESLSLLFIYAAGNYLVVRELSVEFMGLYVEDGNDIPFALIFYALTVLIPVGYLFFGIRNKDIVLLRVSLIVLAFSVFTFKFYFSLGHPEITFTIAGVAILSISILLLNYLKKPRNGFTRENILSEKWANMNAEAFIISQTMGGNKVTNTDQFAGGGGSFGGGGSSGGY
jgi:uncharacterized membrane protein YgcG